MPARDEPLAVVGPRRQVVDHFTPTVPTSSSGAYTVRRTADPMVRGGASPSRVRKAHSLWVLRVGVTRSAASTLPARRLQPPERRSAHGGAVTTGSALRAGGEIGHR